jgi:hypothetical protein
LSKLLSGKHIKQQRGIIKRSFNILEAYVESLNQNQPSVNKVNVRLRKLTKDYGDCEIILQESKNAVTTDEEAEQEYSGSCSIFFLLSLLSKLMSRRRIRQQHTHLAHERTSTIHTSMHRIRQDYLKL